ncbi:SNARE-like superfamily protein [Striga hermonthica]|uniref:SNARE-like superfamily protein n=1 Tax=Striga hermonthica TaxID=68872 RepID=A0A9N7RJY9_STRHE|nr:SNARE-like superfamily protein [Striga hermonthica]
MVEEMGKWLRMTRQKTPTVLTLGTVVVDGEPGGADETTMPNLDLIHYACIAYGTTVLAEFNSKDAALGEIAAKCLDHTPRFHSLFTHTVRSRTYAFLIDGDFAYFAIFDDRLEKPDGFAFLTSVRRAFANVYKGQNDFQKLSSHCYQGELSPVFRQLVGSCLDDGKGMGSPTGSWLSHSKDFQSMPSPIRGRPKPLWENGLKKTKNRGWETKENEEDIGNGRNTHRNGGLYSGEISSHQKAKKVWKKQVWVVLSLDLVICVVLFGVWLWVCSGFKCID